MSELDRLHYRDDKMAASAKPVCANVISVCAPVCISKYCDENNGTGTDNWIPVRTVIPKTLGVKTPSNETV